MTHALGVDLAKDSFVVALFDDRGHRLGPAQTFPNTEKGFGRLLASLKKPRGTDVFFESTGCYGKLLAFFLHGKVRGLYELNPQIVKRLRSSMAQTKTDPADAVAIAKVALLLRNSEPKALERYRVELDEDRENLGQWVAEHHRITRAIVKLKAQIQTTKRMPYSDSKLILARREAELDFLSQSKKEVASVIEEKMRVGKIEEDAELVLSIPGIGPLTAAALITSIRSIGRFEEADALKAYLGVYPRRWQSGAREGRSRMARHGNKVLKHMLWNAAKCAARHNPDCCALYERMIAANKSAPSAYGAVARKLIQICYGVLVHRTKFAPQTA